MAVVVFDLDDTLYKEQDFVHSAFRAIANALSNKGIDASEAYRVMEDAFSESRNPIDAILANYPSSIGEEQLVDIYRNHEPNISLDEETISVLSELQSLRHELALITDGRSRSQRNKIAALGLERYMPASHMYISEETGADKSHPDNFVAVQRRYPREKHYVYVGDNPAKDFVQPNRLGWVSVCLEDDGRNIHSQKVTVKEDAEPRYSLRSMGELPRLLEALFNL